MKEKNKQTKLNGIEGYSWSSSFYSPPLIYKYIYNSLTLSILRAVYFQVITLKTADNKDL